jgi:hypothetical protein
MSKPIYIFSIIVLFVAIFYLAKELYNYYFDFKEGIGMFGMVQNQQNIVAAAAVALLGSLAAFMVPGEIRNVEKSVTGNVSASFPAPLTAAPELVAPASFNPNPSVTQDQGVIWRGKNQPNRVLSRTYMDQVLSKDADGNPIIELRPRVEYEITPEKID